MTILRVFETTTLTPTQVGIVKLSQSTIIKDKYIENRQINKKYIIFFIIIFFSYYNFLEGSYKRKEG